MSPRPGFLHVLIGALAAPLQPGCAPPAEGVVPPDRTLAYQRAGASPPLDGPRFIGPIARHGEGAARAGFTLGQVRKLERTVEAGAPANVAARQSSFVGYSDGVAPGVEAGAGLLLANAAGGGAVARDTPRAALDSKLFGGAFAVVRSIVVEDRTFFLAGSAEIVVWSLPYYERITESKPGQAPTERQPGTVKSTGYLQVRGGLLGGVRATSSLVLTAGWLVQNYPVFRGGSVLYPCSSDCMEGTDLGIAMTPSMSVTFSPSRFSASLQVFETVTATHHLESALPFGASFAAAYVFGGRGGSSGSGSQHSARH